MGDSAGSQAGLAPEKEIYLKKYRSLSSGRRQQVDAWLREFANYLRPSCREDPTGMILYIINENHLDLVFATLGRDDALFVHSSLAITHAVFSSKCWTVESKRGDEPPM